MVGRRRRRRRRPGGISNLTWMTTDYQTSYDLIAPLIPPPLPPLSLLLPSLHPPPLLPLSLFLSLPTLVSPISLPLLLFLLLSLLFSALVPVLTPSSLSFFSFTSTPTSLLHSLPPSFSSSSPLHHFLPPAPHLSQLTTRTHTHLLTHLHSL